VLCIFLDGRELCDIDTRIISRHLTGFYPFVFGKRMINPLNYFRLTLSATLNRHDICGISLNQINCVTVGVFMSCVCHKAVRPDQI
jgi:hypothetical protein